VSSARKRLQRIEVSRVLRCCADTCGVQAWGYMWCAGVWLHVRCAVTCGYMWCQQLIFDGKGLGWGLMKRFWLGFG
jgi:hypothetical protein